VHVGKAGQRLHRSLRIQPQRVLGGGGLHPYRVTDRHGRLPGIGIADKVLDGWVGVRLDATVTPRTWPWAQDIATAWNRVQALPQRP